LAAIFAKNIFTILLTKNSNIMKRTLLFTCAALVFAATLFSCEDKGTETGNIAVTGITVAPQSYTLAIGGEVTLTATIAPEDATNKDMTWETSDATIATVEAGVVTGIAAGEASITVTSTEGGHEATCAITVNEEGVDVILPETIELSKESIKLQVGGEPFTLTYTINPDNATNKEVIWESNDPKIAEVSQDGVVTPVAGGDTYITVTTVDGGKNDICQVVVEVPVEGVSWLLSPIQTVVDEPFDLTGMVSITPENATNKNFTITSADPSTVSLEGNVMTAHKPGDVILTVITEENNNIKAELTIQVIDMTVHVESVELDRESITLMFPDGNAKTLNATVLPGDAENKALTWESDNTGVVTVSDGVLTPVGEGTAKITVKSADNSSVTDECTVAVTWLGEVSFLTENTWKPIGTGNGRTISDVVMVERARGKTTFNGGMGVPGNVDVRENNAGYGDLMSWATVDKYKAELCPAPWFVPTNNDFFALDRDLGGSGNGGAGMAVKYEQQMGVTYGGMTYPTGPMNGQDQMAFYWTTVKSGSSNVFVLEVNRATTVVSNQKFYQPSFGLPVRCVKM
jgi:uncharacterized protein (TIGR02145 family)